jgi:C1A family cysteine protease
MVFGFTVYESFEIAEVARTGIVNMPGAGEHAVGGHAVMAVGYDDHGSRFIVRNSWSEQWGIQGYFTMPYDYLLNENLSDDFWTVRLIEANPAIKKK